MQIEITERIDKIKVIEVELPYYYKHDLMSDYGNNIIYGKIEKKKHTSIQEITGSKTAYELEAEMYSSIKKTGLASYFEVEHKSTKEEYEAAKERALSFLNDC